MSRIIRFGLILGSFVTLVAIGRASAQVVDPITFQTSFAFTVNGHEMPAGRYEIRPVDDQRSVLELTTRGLPRTRGMFFEVENVEKRPGTEAPETALIFLHSGSTYALRDVWIAGESTGAETLGKLPESLRAARKAGTVSEVRIVAEHPAAARS